MKYNNSEYIFSQAIFEDNSTPLFEKLNIILAQYPGARRRWFGSYFLRFDEKQKNVTSTQTCKTTYCF